MHIYYLLSVHIHKEQLLPASCIHTAVQHLNLAHVNRQKHNSRLITNTLEGPVSLAVRASIWRKNSTADLCELLEARG